MTLLQDLPHLLVEAHRHSVDGSIQPASPQPLALPLLPVQLAVSQTGAQGGQHAAGGGGAAATLRWEIREKQMTWSTSDFQPYLHVM